MSLWPDVKMFGSSDVSSWTRGILRAKAQNIVRNICGMPSNHLTPIELVQKAIELKDRIVPAVIIFNIFWLILLIKKKETQSESDEAVHKAESTTINKSTLVLVFDDYASRHFRLLPSCLRKSY